MQYRLFCHSRTSYSYGLTSRQAAGITIHVVTCLFLRSCPPRALVLSAPHCGHGGPTQGKTGIREILSTRLAFTSSCSSNTLSRPSRTVDHGPTVLVQPPDEPCCQLCAITQYPTCYQKLLIVKRSLMGLSVSFGYLTRLCGLSPCAAQMLNLDDVFVRTAELHQRIAAVIQTNSRLPNKSAAREISTPRTQKCGENAFVPTPDPGSACCHLVLRRPRGIGAGMKPSICHISIYNGIFCQYASGLSIYQVVASIPRSRRTWLHRSEVTASSQP